MFNHINRGNKADTNLDLDLHLTRTINLSCKDSNRRMINSYCTTLRLYIFKLFFFLSAGLRISIMTLEIMLYTIVNYSNAAYT